MKKNWILILALAWVLVSALEVCGAEPAYKMAAQFQKGRLTITSFCEEWGEQDLAELYEELMANTIGPELPYLKAIYIFPDSPYGVTGNYYEDIKESQAGRYMLGTGCYIELYNGSEKVSVEEMATALSHEYGHHFTIFNMMVYEKNHYRNWAQSEYAALRGLEAYPVIYSKGESGAYHKIWDVLEIAANDYVQLLGSDLAKKSYRYLDAKQFVEQGAEGLKYHVLHFNARPQENMELPLAAQVDGLYEYFLKISGNEALIHQKKPTISSLPAIKKITEEKAFINKTYNLVFTKALGAAPFEYTILLYPRELSEIPAVIKTLSDGQPLQATFGTLLGESPDGTLIPSLDYYGGMCELVIYAKDINGFIYASESYFYDFGDDYFDLKKTLTDIE